MNNNQDWIHYFLDILYYPSSEKYNKQLTKEEQEEIHKTWIKLAKIFEIENYEGGKINE